MQEDSWSFVPGSRVFWYHKISTVRKGLQMKNRNEQQETILGFMQRIKQDHVSAYAAQAAYFMILSFIPFILFLTTLIRYTPLTYDMMQQAMNNIIPEGLQGYVMNIMLEVYHRNTALMPLTALTALWSAGKGLQAITNGLNCIYHVHETRNWLITRIYSVFYTVIFVFSIIGCLLVLVLGNAFQKPLLKYVPILGKLLGKILGSRSILVVCILVAIFTFLYKYLPNRKASLRNQLPGAMLTTAAWILFSYAVSLYFKYWPSFSNMYGSLTAVIMLLLWLYGCMNIVLYGAEINAYFEEDFLIAQGIARELFEKEDTDAKR